jgi:UDP-N-acetylglucosamine transferase subunit ALG13
MKRRYAVFATVGTTSFDDFVESLCSLHFLTAMAHYHPRPRHIADIDDDDYHDSDGSDGVAAAASHSLVLTIQYGGGMCPSSFIPPILIDSSIPTLTNDDDDDHDDVDDGSGSIFLSIPMHRPPHTPPPPPPSGALRGGGGGGGGGGGYVWETHRDGYATSFSGDHDRNHHHRRRVLIEWYRYRSSLFEEMIRADAIFCHAGAGTLLEALEISSSSSSSSSSSNAINNGTTKIIVAVINTKLMDNHQSELAIEFENMGHVYVSRNCMMEWIESESSARNFWEYVGTRDLVPFYMGGGIDISGRRYDDREGSRVTMDGPGGHVSGFQSMVDRIMGFGEEQNGKIPSKTL